MLLGLATSIIKASTIVTKTAISVKIAKTALEDVVKK